MPPQVVSSSTPSLCGGFLQNKRSLIAFVWTVTTFCTWIACLLAICFSIQISSYYNRMEQNYVDQQNQGDPGRRFLQESEEDSRDAHSGDNAADSTATLYYLLAHTSSTSMAFVAAYMTVLALGLTLYGSTAIVGFTSLQGDYIAPCISSGGGGSLLRDGVFGGAVVMFANLLLVCAVIFGEFRVEDSYSNNNNDDNQGEREHQYAVERIASVLAVTCVFLAVLYSTFAILLFLNLSSNDSSLEYDYYSDEIEMNYRHHHDDKIHDRESSTGARQQFITIDSSNSSSMMYDDSNNNKNDDNLPTLPSQGFMTMSPSER